VHEDLNIFKFFFFLMSFAFNIGNSNGYSNDFSNIFLYSFINKKFQEYRSGFFWPLCKFVLKTRSEIWIFNSSWKKIFFFWLMRWTNLGIFLSSALKVLRWICWVRIYWMFFWGSQNKFSLIYNIFISNSSSWPSSTSHTWMHIHTSTKSSS